MAASLGQTEAANGGLRPVPRRLAAAPALALSVLVALVVASPWAFGSVDPGPRFGLAALSLLGAALALAAGARSGGVRLPDVPLWPLLALLALGAGQLVPLPEPLLRILAPGPSAAWHPASPAAAGVLGTGARPISLDPEATVRGLWLAAGLIGLALAAAPALTRPTQARRAAWAVTAAGAGLAVYGILAQAHFGPLLYGRLAVPTVSPFGPFVSKNHFAAYVGPAALLALGLCLGRAARSRSASWTGERSASGVVGALVAALAMVLSLVVCQSRGGFLATAFGAAALAVLALPEGRLRGRGPAALLALFLLGLLAVAAPEAARARLASFEGASFRLDTWRDGLRLFTRSPLVGHGFGAFADAYASAKRGHGAIRVEHAENEYVELLAEGGLAGLGLALAAFAMPLGRALKVRQGREPLVRGLLAGATAGLFAMAVHGVFDFGLHIPSNAALAALLAGFLASGPGLRERRLSPAASLAVALLLLALGLRVLSRGPAAFDGETDWREVRREVTEAADTPSPEVRVLRVERATARLERVLDRRPAFAEGWLLLAALRREGGEAAEASDLAGHAAALDPSRPDLQAGAERLRAPAEVR